MAVYTDDQGNQFASVKITWDANTELDLAYYVVEWSRDGTDWQSTQANKDATSCRIDGLGLGVAYYFRVRAVDKAGNASDWTNVNAGNPITMDTDETAPDEATDLTAYSLNRAIKLTWTNPTQKDFSHVEVWRNDAGAWDDTEEKVAEVDGTSWTDELNTREATFYYALKSVDGVGNDSSGTTWVEGETDTTAPDPPTGVSASTGTVVDADGKIITHMTVSWTYPSPIADVVSFEIQAWFDIDGDGYADEDPENWTVSAEDGESSGTLKRYGVPGNVDYRVRARSVDDAGLKSAWSAYDSGTTPADSTGPADATGMSVTSKKKGIVIEFDKPSEADWAGVEIHASTSGSAFTPGSANLIADIRGNKHEHETSSYSTHYVKIRLYDSSGNYNPSGYQYAGSAAPAQQSSSDIGSGQIGNTHIPNSGLDAIKILIGAGVNLNDWHLGWGYMNWAYIANVVIETADIGNAQITNAKIDSMSADKITAGTITATVSLGAASSIEFTNSGHTLYGMTGGIVASGNFSCSRLAAYSVAVGSGTMVVDENLNLTNVDIDSGVTGGGGLDVDKVDGYDAGNANGDIPISNGTVCTNLNADMLDGQHASAFYESGDSPTFDAVTATSCSLISHGGGAFPSTQVRIGDGLVKLTSVESPAFLFLDVHDEVDERLLGMTEGDVWLSPLFKYDVTKPMSAQCKGKPAKYLVLAGREGYADKRFAKVECRECQEEHHG